MPGIPHSAIGQFKTKAVADQLLAQRPDLGITCCEHSLLTTPAAAMWSVRSDLIVTCVDDDAARVISTIHARRMLVPHLDLATSVQKTDEGGRRVFGDVRLFLPGQGCAVRAQVTTKSARRSATNWQRRREHSIGASLGNGTNSAGSLVEINALTVAAGVSSWLDLLAGDLRTELLATARLAPGTGLADSLGGGRGERGVRVLPKGELAN